MTPQEKSDEIKILTESIIKAYVRCFETSIDCFSRHFGTISNKEAKDRIYSMTDTIFNQTMSCIMPVQNSPFED